MECLSNTPLVVEMVIVVSFGVVKSHELEPFKS